MGMNYRQTKRLLQNLKRAADGMDEFLRDFLKTEALKVLRDIKKRTPVDTGNLRNRWELSDVYGSGTDIYIIIFNPSEYTSFVEEGHWQNSRFLPIHYLDNGSPKSKAIAGRIRAKYGQTVKGVKLQHKWIPGYYMARVPMAKLERNLPKNLDRAFVDYMKRMGVI